MNDFNFFASYENRMTATKSLFLPILSLVLFLIIAVYIAVVEISVFSYKNTLNEQIVAYEEMLASTSNTALEKIYDELNQALSVYNNYNSILDAINTGLLEAEKIDSSQIQKIAEVMPKDVFVSTASINGSTVSMSCTTNDRVKAAEFEHNLKELDFIEDVFIGSIIKASDVDRYSFPVNCVVKEVIKIEGAKKE